MATLTDAQQGTLDRMRGYRVVAQLDTGAALVVYGRRYQDARVIDATGQVCSFSRYLSILDFASLPFSDPCAILSRKCSLKKRATSELV